jgi:2-polyprenyl-3-methyl-5-hydroxy-6-metoxy-1,4-benzoquinol methylase
MKQRSTEKELMDLGPSFYAPEEYADCLKKLFYVNRILGFFRHTVKSLKSFPKNASLLDVGCGGGLFLLHLSRHYPSMHFYGTDIAPDAIARAQNEKQNWISEYPIDVNFYHQNEPELTLDAGGFDVVLTTLVCHHLDDATLVSFLKNALHGARIAVLINDLHRHPIAYWCYFWMSRVFFRNRLITHDGLISIQRGFTRKEWHALMRAAQIEHYEIKWCFPFRWSVVLWKK